MIWAYVNGHSGRSALHELEKGLNARRFPMDGPIQDTMSIGGG
jgi:hypothetical protein